MDSEESCCRLCAMSKFNNNQVDLQANVDRKDEIKEKLTRVNAAVDFDVDLLPKTVCFDCIHALEKAYDFVVAVEWAQTQLNQSTAEPEVYVAGYQISLSPLIEYTVEVEVGSVPNCDLILSGKKESDEDFSAEFDHERRETTCSPETREIKLVPKKLIKQEYKSAISELKSWIDYRWYCTVCESLFDSVEELQKHSMVTHNTCNPYRCTDCNYRSSKLDMFLRHIEKHHEQLKLSCYKCFKHFEKSSTLKKHKSTHISTSFVCFGCKNSFTSNDELQNHIKDACRVKRTRKIPVELQMDGTTCLICQKKFRTKHLLKSHVMTHIDRKECVCEVCGKGFSRKGHLDAHMVTHSDKRAFKCDICNSTFKRHDSLINHSSLHKNEKPFKCSECDRSFRLRTQLKTHMIVHTDMYPYGCPICPRRFRFKGKLTDHARVHSGDMPYSCKICPRDFCGWSNYNKHMRNMHNIDIAKKKRPRQAVLKANVKHKRNKVIDVSLRQT